MRHRHLGIIGCGKMGEALVQAILAKSEFRRTDIVCSNRNRAKRKRLRQILGVDAVSTNTELIRRTRLVVLAVKPQDVHAVAAEIGGNLSSEHLIISIVAGKGIRLLTKCFAPAQIVRAMPNLACAVSQSATVFCCAPRVTQSGRRLALIILSCLGPCMPLAERHFDAVTALSGSGPGFLAFFLNEMVHAAEAHGLPHRDARLLAAQTTLGTGAYLLHNAINPADLIHLVTSAKGTTAAGMAILEDGSTGHAIRRAMHAAIVRSRQIAAMKP